VEYFARKAKQQGAELSLLTEVLQRDIEMIEALK
jgi:hypothetical protein